MLLALVARHLRKDIGSEGWAQKRLNEVGGVRREMRAIVRRLQRVAAPP